MQLKVNILQMCFTKCAHFTKTGYYTLDKSKFIHVYIAGHPLLLIVLCHLQQFYSKVPILISYDIPFMWNLKRNDKHELTYKTERDSQT